MSNFTTPMMKQYQAIKSQYPDCLLFYRMGDFYELFMDDAHTGSQILGITLTSRPKGKDGKIPMAGVPHHAVDSYLAKLVKAGYKVAICEQVSEPNKYGIIDREVIRVVTPGTLLDENALEKKENNFLISLTIKNNILAISSADLSTGIIKTTQIEFENLSQTLGDHLVRLNPSECILSPLLYGKKEILKILSNQKGMNIYSFPNWETYSNDARKFLTKHFGIKSLAIFEIEDLPQAIETTACLIGYLKETQKDKINHIKKVSREDLSEFVSLDKSTIINLELFSTIRDHDTKASLLTILDQTKTPMGGRMLKEWMKKPLREKQPIVKRLDAIENLNSNLSKRESLEDLLTRISDVERILSRLSVGIGNARDLVNLKESLKVVLLIKHSLVNREASLLQNIQSSISTKIGTVIKLIEENIVEDPPVSTKDGGIVNLGINKQLDSLKKKIGKSKDWLIELEQKERTRTGIQSLKIRFNKVFGFYIEISKANMHLAPKDYFRKQTLVNAERFITQDLKKQEELILTAEEEIKKIEYEIYSRVLSQVLSFTNEIQKSSFSIATLDCLTSFAIVSNKNNYSKPKILYSGELIIKKGRHPVVEKLLQDTQFVPNDIKLDNIKQQLLLITGPNMAGKSVYLRQIALIVFMAHLGCYVPAEKAYISLVDRIFVRSGASDVISSGLSTFMVEMVETAYILNNATKKSLIVMDEIGRGTSTYDGISIAWSVAEYLVTHFKFPPKTLFATHYHELQTLENRYPNKIRNYHMEVKEEEGEPVFLHTIMPGGASHSFGVAVAKLAGVPSEVIENASKLLKTLEVKGDIEIENNKKINIKNENLIRDILEVDVNNLTPLDAINYLSSLKKRLSK